MNTDTAVAPNTEARCDATPAVAKTDCRTRETIATFGKTGSLVGIVTHPEANPAAALPAVILLNSGFLHRVGPGRLYVKLARTLAARGFLVLRFDLSGIGDSRSSDEASAHDERAIAELGEAMGYLRDKFGADRFVLSGICSGAKIAYQAQCADNRVVGAAPINLYRLLETTDKKLMSAVMKRSETRYLLQFSLLSPASWLKLVSGKADYRGLLRKIKLVLRRLLPDAKQEYPETQQIKSDIRAITERNAHLLLVYSVTDPGLDFVRETLGNEMDTGWEQSGRFRIEVVRANHVFTVPSSQRELIQLIIHWLDSAFIGKSGPG